MAAARSALACVGRAANVAVSFVVFMVLDVLEVLLCVVYKVADYLAEGAWRPCYCSRSSSPAGAASGKIVVSERGGSKVVSMLSTTRLHLEDISDTLYTRPSVLARVQKQGGVSRAAGSTTLTVHSAIVQMLRGADGKQHRPYPSPRWSDCHCANCNPADKDRLFVHVEAPPGTSASITLLLRTHTRTHPRLVLTALLCSSGTAQTELRRRRTCCSSTGSSRPPGSGRRRCSRT
jgi:hypothetical protein